MILAISTQRAIGLAIAAFVLFAFVVYVLVNVFWTGRKEIGSELELAPNRKPYMPDDELETKKLDLSLAAGLATLAIIGVALPLYWLGEPGRQEGRLDFDLSQSASRGEDSYVERCAQCHGVEGVGGQAAFTVTDDNGRFVATVNWNAPALDGVLYRFSKEEVRWVLNFGRPQSPMPAFGSPGGGPLTEAQVEDLLVYLQEIQISPEELAETVDAGITQAARIDYLEINPDMADADPDELDAAVLQFVEEASVSQFGQWVFDNPIGAGAYNCARCHTAGNSWNSDQVALDPDEPFGDLIELQVPGGGGFGPNLTGGAELRQFDTVESQETFIAIGSQEGIAYGNNGMGDGGGQMPAYGICAADRDAGERDVINEFCLIEEPSGELVNRGGTLTPEQIAAVTEYERGL